MIDIGSSYNSGITGSAHFKMKIQNNADGTALWKAIFWEGYICFHCFLLIFLFAFWLKALCLILDVFMLPACYILGPSPHLASFLLSLW